MNKTVAGLLVLALAVGACSPAPPPQGVAPAAPDGADAADGSQTGLELLDVTKPIDLVFWRQSFREDSAEALQQHFIDSFMNKHPNIKVDVKKFDYNKLLQYPSVYTGGYATGPCGRIRNVGLGVL